MSLFHVGFHIASLLGAVGAEVTTERFFIAVCAEVVFEGRGCGTDVLTLGAGMA